MSEFGWVEMKMLGERIGGIAPEAFQFVREGLGHTVKMVHGEHQEVASRTGASPVSSDSPGPDARHISGRQLCMGLRDYAVKRYGLMARTVLRKWNVQRTEDFGRIVFAMVDQGIMRKAEEDSFEDFQGVFDFSEAFGTLNDQ